MALLLSYGSNLSLASDEILDFRIQRTFNIGEIPTVGDLSLTQPGNVTPTIFIINTRITNYCDVKMTDWLDNLALRPLEELVFLGYNWGNYYLNSVDINSNDLDDNGSILRMNMTVSFTSNQNLS